jgi:hypothetical protein
MLSNSYETNSTSYYYRKPQANSYVRVFNALTSAPAIDVYANGNLIIQNLAYGQFSPYIPVTPGNYNINIFPTGQVTTPLIATNIIIPTETIFNLAVIGNVPNVEIYTIPEPVAPINFGRACIRFIHLSSNAPAVDITLQNGQNIFTSVGYKDITDYVCVPPGTYTFEIKVAGTNNVALTVPNLQLQPNTYYSIYIIGLVGQYPPLQAVAISEPR